MEIERTFVRWSSWVGLVSLLPVMACAVDTSSDDAGEDPATASAATATPTFADDVYPLIEMHCGGGKSGCHISGTSGGLEMPDADAAYAHLVDIDATKCAGQKRVVSGDPDASQLVQALEGTSSCVKPMPLGRDAMSKSDVSTIRAWIQAGAALD